VFIRGPFPSSFLLLASGSWLLGGQMSITESMKLRRSKRKALATATARTASSKDPNAPEGEVEYKPLEWPVVKKVLAWMWPHRKQYALALTLNIIFALLEMSGPLFLKHLVDHDIPGHLHFLTDPLAAVIAWFSVPK